VGCEPNKEKWGVPKAKVLIGRRFRRYVAVWRPSTQYEGEKEA